MRKHTWLLPLAAVLAGGVFFLGVVRARDDADKEEQAKIAAAVKAAPDVQKLADYAAAGGAPLQKQAAAAAKMYDELEPIMWQMKPRGKGGLGVGPAPGVYTNDAIELQLLELGGKQPKNAQYIVAHAADFQRMAQIIKGISAVAPSYVKTYTKTPDEAKAWNGLSDDMGKGADDLITAIKAGNAANFKKAVDDLNRSCNFCHTKFRDN